MAVVLDSSVLYASLDRGEVAHVPCRRLIESTSERLVIPVPVLPEVDYLISRRLFPAVMVSLLDDIAVGAYELVSPEPDDVLRIRDLVDRYADSDIGFVDAAVLAIVERLDEPKVATLDRRHFSMMRPRHIGALELLPSG